MLFGLPGKRDKYRSPSVHVSERTSFSEERSNQRCLLWASTGTGLPSCPEHCHISNRRVRHRRVSDSDSRMHSHRDEGSGVSSALREGVQAKGAQQ